MRARHAWFWSLLRATQRSRWTTGAFFGAVLTLAALVGTLAAFGATGRLTTVRILQVLLLATVFGVLFAVALIIGNAYLVKHGRGFRPDQSYEAAVAMSGGTFPMPRPPSSRGIAWLAVLGGGLAAFSAEGGGRDRLLAFVVGFGLVVAIAAAARWTWPTRRPPVWSVLIAAAVIGLAMFVSVRFIDQQREVGWIPAVGWALLWILLSRIGAFRRGSDQGVLATALRVRERALELSRKRAADGDLLAMADGRRAPLEVARGMLDESSAGADGPRAKTILAEAIDSARWGPFPWSRATLGTE